jgi:hypothetical protein
MAAVISGEGLGLYNSSVIPTGLGGGSNDPQVGQIGDRVYLNTRTGNLVIQQQDEFLASVGLDLNLLGPPTARGCLTGIITTAGG